MKTKAKIILGIADVLFVVLAVVMLISGREDKTQSKVTKDEIKKVTQSGSDVNDEILFIESPGQTMKYAPESNPWDFSGNDDAKEATQGNASNGTPTPQTYNGSVEDDVKRIRAQWQEIQDNSDNYEKVKVNGEQTNYCENVNGENVIRKIIVKNSDATEEYFYSYEGGTYEPFFVFVTGSDKREDRHYFVGYQLIRWIEAQKGGTLHDLDYDNQEYTDRGKTYLNKALDYIGM